MMPILIAVLLIGVVVLVGGLALWSSGKPLPVTAGTGKPAAGSLADKTRVQINDAAQGMFLQSRDERNPVLLFVHGGPGMPEYFLTQWYPTGLEDLFTVCWWEQRGAGLSYSWKLPRATMTAAQFVADTQAVTNYLRQRFGQEKIYLMGHSWGSFLGIQAAAAAPELYHAYIGVGQVSNQLKSENLAYEYMLDQYRARGDARMVRKLEAAPVTMRVPLPDAYMGLRDEGMHRLGIGTTRKMDSVVTGIFVPSWQSRVYTLGEKINLWRGKIESRKLLWNAMLATDLTRQVTALRLPVYLLHGRYDYTCAYSEARGYFETLDAPLKGFYTFEHSAHSPFFEEPERVRAILQRDVLAGVNGMADC